MKKVIVTGVLGQDGSLMVDYLMKNTDYEIYGFGSSDWPRYGTTTFIDNYLLDPRFTFIPLDVTNKKHMGEVIAYVKPDYFLNFAAQTSVVLSKTEPEKTLKVNCFTVSHVLKCLLELKKPVRFFNAGSSEEFSPAEYWPQDEQHPRRFNNPYGISKVLAHHSVEDYRELGLFAIQPYLYNHISDRSSPQYLPKKIVQSFARIHKESQPFDAIDVKKIESIKVGNIHALRDWTAAEEVIEAIWLSLNANEPKDYVISSGRFTSVKQIIDLGFRYATSFPKTGIARWEENKLISQAGWIIAESVPEFYREGEVIQLLGNSSLIYKDLGWKACKPVEKIIEEMIIKEIDRLNKRV